MTRPVSALSSLCVSILLLLPTTLGAATVGSGAPNINIQVGFINAYYRGTFSQLVNVPGADVQALGTPGLEQLFPAKVTNISSWKAQTAYAAGATILDPSSHIQTATTAGTSGSIQPKWNDAGKTTQDQTVTWQDTGLAANTYSLVLADPAALDDPPLVWQVWGSMYTYYTAIGVGSAGYPFMDTTACPTNTLGTCLYQTFTKNYALFVYDLQATNITVKDPYFTAWTNAGGIGTMGAATAASASVTSMTNVVGNQIYFANGVVISYPSSSSTAPAYAVTGDIYTAYLAAGGTSLMGFPTAAPITVNTTTGLIRQTFENGRIEQIPGSTPNAYFTLKTLTIKSATPTLSLQPGATTTISALAVDNRGIAVTGRALTWTSTNGAVATVQGMGDTAIVKGVGGGAANILVTGEGLTSVPLSVRVNSVCCAVGDGTPSAASQSAFQAAVSRNGISVKLPAASPAVRTGAGYAQTLTSADGSGTVYVIAQPDNSSNAWLLTGTLYTAYIANGGLTGPLGYPASDPLPAGVQKFISGAALAGSPVLVVNAAVAAKWFLLGGISGTPGPPTIASAAFQTVGGRSGVAEAFAGGLIVAVTSGSSTGVYFSTGLILARYTTLFQMAGALGAPISDIAISPNGVQTQTFEGGTVDLQPGAAAAVEHLNPRRPALTATPATVVPGGRVHIAATGFAPGANLAFTITGQPNFATVTQSGAFQWDIVVPSSSKASNVAVAVSAQGSTDKASASYSIAVSAATLPKLTLVSGDKQTAQPGSRLAAPVVARLTDSNGSPLSGVPVSVAASPGSGYSGPAATAMDGTFTLVFRLPPAAGVAVGSISAAGKTVDFSALGTPATIPNFPQFAQTDPQGSLTTTLAELIQFQQNSGSLPAPNGSATPTSITTWLGTNNGLEKTENGNNLTDPWVAAQFAKGTVLLEDTNLNHLRDLVNTGVPVGLLLSLTTDGQIAGSHSVAAVGVGSDGSLSIVDPNPTLARTSLADYLNGFSSNPAVQGNVAAAFRIVPQTAATPFVLATPASAGSAVTSAAGACPSLDIADSYGTAAAASPTSVRLSYCDGSQSAYEADFAAQAGGRLVDLVPSNAIVPINSGAGGALRITRGPALQTAPLTPTITSIVDSAAYGAALAPGGLITIFGSGFAGAQGALPTVTVGGLSAIVLAAFPFQINAAVPPTVGVGKTTVTVSAASGSVSQDVTLTTTAPGIFVIGTSGGTSIGAIVNLDGTINGPDLPAQRGQAFSIYCAGLGVTSKSGSFNTVTNAVTVQIDGTAVTPSFAGLLPGFVGLYQVNVTIPAGLAPSATASLAIKQAGRTSNAVPLAYQ